MLVITDLVENINKEIALAEKINAEIVNQSEEDKSKENVEGRLGELKGVITLLEKTPAEIRYSLTVDLAAQVHGITTAALKNVVGRHMQPIYDKALSGEQPPHVEIPQAILDLVKEYNSLISGDTLIDLNKEIAGAAQKVTSVLMQQPPKA